MAATCQAKRCDGYGNGWDGVSDQTLFLQLLYDQRNGNGGPVSDGLPTVVVDHHQTAFGTTGGRHWARDFDVLKGRIHNVLTDSWPVALHCPGRRWHQREFERLEEQGWATPVRRCGTRVETDFPVWEWEG